MKIKYKLLVSASLVFLTLMFTATTAYAEPAFPVPKVGFDISPANEPKDVVASMQILLILTVLALAPSIIIMMTSFTRIIIVLSFLRNALGTQQMPPNQILIGLALFLTFFIMTPVATKINDEAVQPYVKGEIKQEEALGKASTHLRNFMYKYTREKDLQLFLSLSEVNTPVEKDTVPLTIVIPAFLISELKTAFIMGFLIYLPFLVIDMVVSSTLMSMGMMMLPPVMISLPFKILLFIMVDGWNLVVQAVVNSFMR